MIRNLLESNATFATPIILYMVNDIGVDALQYEPETIKEYLQGINPSVRNDVVDRVVAASGLYTSNLFWYDPVCFATVCRALNRASKPLAVSADIDDIAWGVTESSILFTGESEKFSESIRKYIAYTLKSDGIYTTPTSLLFIGKIPYTPAIDDAEMVMNIQEHSDSAASAIDTEVDSKILQLFNQIKLLKLPMTKEANSGINNILSSVQI